MAEVVEACACNFEGKEDVHQLLLSAPCYGNDDPYAEDITVKIDELNVLYNLIARTEHEALS